MSASPAVPEELLLDYAAGGSDSALDLLIATHLSMSKGSRELCSMLEAVGGVLLETLDGEPLERVTAMSVLEEAERGVGAGAMAISGVSRIETSSADGQALAPAKFGGDAPPLPLQAYAADYADEHAWRRLGWSVAAARLSVPDEGERAHLLWAKPGAAIATHRHIGREVVLVLKGAFWDQGVRFGPGDIAVGEDGTVHAPRIDDETECICLAVTAAPVQFVGPFGWALNRFCRF